VTLVAPASGDSSTPDGFHRQLIKIAAELFGAAEARVVGPVCDQHNGWQWVTEPL
jgi:hypothetical protein